MRGKKNSGPSCAAAALPHLHMPGSGATSQLYAPARPRHSCGYSATISSVVSPLATRPTIVATGIRVPATQGTPPMI
jgi:hypothetical protein